MAEIKVDAALTITENLFLTQSVRATRKFVDKNWRDQLPLRLVTSREYSIKPVIQVWMEVSGMFGKKQEHCVGVAIPLYPVDVATYLEEGGGYDAVATDKIDRDGDFFRILEITIYDDSEMLAPT